MNRDLTVGEPGKVLWRFCLPLFGSVKYRGQPCGGEICRGKRPGGGGKQL